MKALEQFTIVRRIEIDAAHRVPDHASKCRALHGHRYCVEAHCVGTLSGDGEETGMVVDFGFLKDAMMTTIHGPCDHALLLWEDDPILNVFPTDADWLKLVFVPDVPTAENLARFWFTLLEPIITQVSQARAELLRIVVHETPNCQACYPAWI